jgi:hypothetical protein
MFIEIPQEEKDRLAAENPDVPLMVIKIPIVKATRKDDPSWVEVNINACPDDVVKEIYLQGLKVLLNRGMSKITGTKTDESVRQVMEVAAKNLEDLYAGKIRMSAGVRTKVSGAVKTEAMRIARMIIKDGIRDSGGKISHYTAKDITKAAADFLDSEEGKSVWEEAKAAVEARTSKEKKSKAAVKDIVSKITVDPKLVAKAEAAAASRKKKTGEEAKANLAAAAQAGAAKRQGGAHVNR